MAQISLLQSPAAADEPLTEEVLPPSVSTADYGVLRAQLDMADGAMMADEGEGGGQGEGAGQGRLRLIGSLRANKRTVVVAAATTATTATTTAAATRDVSAQTAAASFRPGDPNEGLGADEAGDTDEQKLQKLQKLLPLGGGRLAAGATTNRRARQLMVAPKASVRGKPNGKSNGWQNGRPNGSSSSRPGRGYESSSDEDVGRGSLGRKKVRKG